MWNKYESIYERGLIDNASDSLKTGIGYLVKNEATHFKYVILLTAHSVELFLKARLAQVHDCLLFPKPEDFHPRIHHGDNEFTTVNIAVLKGRLKAVGVHLSDDEKDSLTKITSARNRIQHFTGSTLKLDAELHLVNVLLFLERFLPGELRIEISSIFEPKVIQALKEIQAKQSNAFAAAQKDIVQAQADGASIFRCLHCHQLLVPGWKYSEKVACLLCKTEGVLDSCDDCGKLILSTDLRENENPKFPLECGKCEEEMYRQIAEADQ